MKSGFTLIEVMMTIVVISILATIGITQFTNFSKDARIAVTNEKLMALKMAINGDPKLISAGQYSKPGYEANCSAPPTVLTDLITKPGAGTCASDYDPFTKLGWRGPYVSSDDANWNKDAWGVAFEYFVAGPPARTIRSCGPDQTCGNIDDQSVTF
jgi:prepilin-type N-terminal cleavage/methylation domain-containing protein